MNSPESVQEYFDILARTDTWAPLYDKTHRRAYNYLSRRKAVESLISGEQFCRVLDIGCGTGDYLMALRDRNIEYVGIDFSKSMIARAKERFRNMDLAARYSFEVADALNLPYENASFDLVLAIGLIEYFDAPEKLLESIRRVVKPNGILICQSINRSWIPRYWCNRLLQAAKESLVNTFRLFCDRNAPRTVNPRHALFSKRELDGILRGFGFQNTGHLFTNYGIVPFLEIIHPVLHARLSEAISSKHKASLSCLASNYIGKYEKQS